MKCVVNKHGVHDSFLAEHNLEMHFECTRDGLNHGDSSDTAVSITHTRGVVALYDLRVQHTTIQKTSTLKSEIAL